MSIKPDYLLQMFFDDKECQSLYSFFGQRKLKEFENIYSRNAWDLCVSPLVLGCRIKANCPHVGPAPARGVPSVRGG